MLAGRSAYDLRVDPESSGAGSGSPVRRETWTAYAYLSVFGFYLYAIGALTPYLRDELHLSAAQAALHPSALAIGMVSAGTIADALERRLGRRWAGRPSACWSSPGRGSRRRRRCR